MLTRIFKKSFSWLILIALFFGGQAWINRDLVEGVPPPIRAETLNKEMFQLEQFKGEPAIIYFWASWCGICRTMESGISKLSQQVPLMSIALQSGDTREVSSYLEKKGLKTPVIIDPTGQLSSTYGIKGVPAVFILDKSGQIRYATSGYSPNWAIKTRLWLAGL